MSKKSLKSSAIDIIITAIINALYVWARRWGNNAYFYILIGDDDCQDVAWCNSDAVESIAPKLRRSLNPCAYPMMY